MAGPTSDRYGMRLARTFDGTGPGGRPVVHRPPVDPGERDQVLAYLESAVIVVSTPGGYKPDVYDPGAPAGVPEKTYTDGTWVWPADVYFYLRKHQIPPEPDLLAHIRAQDYRVPQVDESQRAVATALATGAPPPPRMAPPMTSAPPHPVSPPGPVSGAPPGPPPYRGPAAAYPPQPAPGAGYPPGGPAYGPPPQQKSGMSGGAIAAIVIGAVLVILLLCCCGLGGLGYFSADGT